MAMQTQLAPMRMGHPCMRADDEINRRVIKKKKKKIPYLYVIIIVGAHELKEEDEEKKPLPARYSNFIYLFPLR